ncbi:helix-turn-helix transcriptional regulator [Methylobacterium sp. SyP6R]|uniref:helix-turn-helix transcriptional regulator n=1 Tax=Methylobacterium sp. SyP6R TaxID=2718876 RepID=UPI001F3003FD|nr:AraC family transcriptional regulator [Methylobacterium sp. SyP6R]MCF4127718.1 AraC family transcriptional regulator [Methylobacterium sp. SyP6R]
MTGSPPPADLFLGERFAAHLGVAGDWLHGVHREDHLRIGVTRLSGRHALEERLAPTVAEDAFSLVHLLRGLDLHERWCGGRRVFGGAYAADTVSVLDLREPVQCRLRGEVDAVQYYVPRAALDAFARDNDAGPVDTLAWCRQTPDPIVASLSRILLAAPAAGPANGVFVEQICLGLLAHFAGTYGRMRPGTPCIGGLAAWQERRAREIMQARFATRLTITDIARECGLTASHFARAFRRSTGQPPHRTLTEIRIERAKALLRDEALSLSDIALACGFNDQSYFTRIFTRAVGSSPGQWRRAHRG